MSFCIPYSYRQMPEKLSPCPPGIPPSVGLYGGVGAVCPCGRCLCGYPGAGGRGRAGSRGQICRNGGQGGHDGRTGLGRLSDIPGDAGLQCLSDKHAGKDVRLGRHLYPAGGGGLQHMGRSGAKNKAACYSGLPPAQRPKRFDELESHAPMAKSIYSYSERRSSAVSEKITVLKRADFSTA